MSKRSASYFLKVLSVLVTPLVMVGLTASSGSAATATTPTFFGAKLTSQSQPSNAENGQSCDENAGIPHGSTCTWVAISAFENGSHFTAPKTGTVKHVKLVSCVKAGSFRLQLAKASPSARKARIVVKRPRDHLRAARVRVGVPAATTTSSRASGSICMSPRVTTSPSRHDPPERCRARVATASSCTPRRCPWVVRSRSHTRGPAATSWSSSATGRRGQPLPQARPGDARRRRDSGATHQLRGLTDEHHPVGRSADSSFPRRRSAGRWRRRDQYASNGRRIRTVRGSGDTNGSAGVVTPWRVMHLRI